MNLDTSNLVRGNLTIFKYNTFKAMIIGILLMAVLVTSNTYGTAFAQNCYKVKVTISGLPKQTSYASTQVALSNTGSGNGKGTASISIPGIGSGQVAVLLKSINDPFPNDIYRVLIAGLSDQTGAGESSDIPVHTVCGPSANPIIGDIHIPGIGVGSLTITTEK
jgi:hypothetical protein